MNKQLFFKILTYKTNFLSCYFSQISAYIFANHFSKINWNPEGLKICSLCREKAENLTSEGRYILDKDTEKNIIIAKHYEMHSCHIEVTRRSKDIIKIAKEFPRLTRESMVRQKGNSSSSNHVLRLLQL